MMYAEREQMFSSFQNFSQEMNDIDYFCRYHKSHFPPGNLVQTSTIAEYDLWGEGDLFKAPDAIIEEPVMSFDPMTAAISMISCGENISPQSFKVANIESIQSEQLLSEVFYECKRDILAKDAIETPLSEVLDIKIPALGTVEIPFAENRLITPGSFPKSVSSECLSSMDWMHGSSARPDFLDFHGMDLGDMYGMRRSFSEGDIKTLGNGPLSLMHSPRTLPQIFSNCTTEDRQQKLSRYRNKKSKRNFGRKIKYACRKALADTQPRIRGRFAKTEESDGSKNFIAVRP